MLSMVEKVKFMQFPDDDGLKQRAWVTDAEKRGTEACERTIRVLAERPWISEIEETDRNQIADRYGVDIFMKMDERVLEIIDVWREGLPIPVQVKSSEIEQRRFKMQHKKQIFNSEKGRHIFVFDGQDALDVIAADLVGQMIVLAYFSGSTDEQGLLKFLEEDMGDSACVIRYRENRELLLDSKWYGDLILNLEKS